MFEKYLNLNGNSGVSMYEVCPDRVVVVFAGSNKVYEYSRESAGEQHVEAMKKLAKSGRGLNAYINRNVRFSYVR